MFHFYLEDVAYSKTNRFHVAVRLFSNRSQKTSNCRKNISDTRLSPVVTLFFFPHFDVICDQLLNRRTATWNLSVYKSLLMTSSMRLSCNRA